MDTPDRSSATDITHNGVVVGTLGSTHAFVEREGRVTRFAVPGSVRWRIQINDEGDILASQIIRSSYDLDPREPVIFRRNGEVARVMAFGQPVVIGSLADGGAVAGIIAERPEPHGFEVVWRNGRAAWLPALSSTDHRPGRGLGIAANGAVVGGSAGLPVMWRGGKPKALPRLPGYPEGAALAINESGQIVGYCNGRTGTTYSDPDERACLWENGAVRDLGALEKNSRAGDINEKGQAVGTAEVVRLHFDRNDSNWIRRERLSRAMLFENGEAIDLNRLIPRRSGWTLQEAMAINNEGQIVGTGRYKGQERGFVLTPVRGE